MKQQPCDLCGKTFPEDGTSQLKPVAGTNLSVCSHHPEDAIEALGGTLWIDEELQKSTPEPTQETPDGSDDPGCESH